MSIEAILLVITFAVLLALDMPVAFAIGCATFVAINASGDIPAGYQVAKKMSIGVESFPILAIPFFILAGQLMGEGGIASRLMQLANALVGRFRGGLAYVTTITCMLFGAISGSAAAAISSIGGLMIPEMEKRGYPRAFSVALTSTAATTGLLIPPSNVMIVYALMAEGVSVSSLFLAGIAPGLLVGLLILVVCRLKAGDDDQPNAEEARELGVSVLSSFVGALPSLLLIFIVLGGILGGIFSATEAAAIAVAYAFCVPGVHWLMEIAGRLRRGERLDRIDVWSSASNGAAAWVQKMPAALLQSGKTTAIVTFLIAASQAMSWFLAYEQLPQQLSQVLLSLSDQPIVILLTINMLLLMVGFFLDITPAILIFTPILLPVAKGLGVDPVHFGVMMVANLCIGLCTPPVGSCLFVGCSVGKADIVAVTRQMIPFYAAMLIALAAITFLPSLSLSIPRWIGLM